MAFPSHPGGRGMPITQVRIVNPQYVFEEELGLIVQIFPEDTLGFGVFFPTAMVSGRYPADDLEIVDMMPWEILAAAPKVLDTRFDQRLVPVNQAMEVSFPEITPFPVQENEPIQENIEIPPAVLIDPELGVLCALNQIEITITPDTRNLRQLPLIEPNALGEREERDLNAILARIPAGAGLGIIRKPLPSPHYGWLCWWDEPPFIPRRPSRPGLLYRVNILLQQGQTLNAGDRGVRSYYEDNLEVVVPMGRLAA